MTPRERDVIDAALNWAQTCCEFHDRQCANAGTAQPGGLALTLDYLASEYQERALLSTVESMLHRAIRRLRDEREADGKEGGDHA